MRTVVVAAVALATLTSTALAEPAGPIGLTDAQMDRVTAGVAYTPNAGAAGVSRGSSIGFDIFASSGGDARRGRDSGNVSAAGIGYGYGPVNISLWEPTGR